jgi:hypothetical protein
MNGSSCLACGYRIDYHDLEGEVITHDDRHLFTRLNCPHCNETITSILNYAGNTGEVVYECTWEKRPCGYQNCAHCLNSNRDEYNKKHAVTCGSCDYHVQNEDDWDVREPYTDDNGHKWQGIHCTDCGSKERSKPA